MFEASAVAWLLLVTCVGASYLKPSATGVLNGMEAAWELPDAPIGVFVLFHGATHRCTDWWQFPGYRDNISQLRARNFALLALGSGLHLPDSKGMVFGFEAPPEGVSLWDTSMPPASNPMVRSTYGAVAEFFDKNGLTRALPLFGMGTSQGGPFLFIAARGFAELSAANGPTVTTAGSGGGKLSLGVGAGEQINGWGKPFDGLFFLQPGPPPPGLTFDAWPPTVFQTMPRDTKFVGTHLRDTLQLLKGAGAPVLALAVLPMPVNASFLSDRIPELTFAESQAAALKLVSYRLLPAACVDGKVVQSVDNKGTERTLSSQEARANMPNEPEFSPNVKWEWPRGSRNALIEAIKTTPSEFISQRDMSDPCLLRYIYDKKVNLRAQRSLVILGLIGAIAKTRRRLKMPEIWHYGEESYFEGGRCWKDMVYHQIRQALGAAEAFHEATGEFIGKGADFLLESHLLKSQERYGGLEGAGARAEA